MASTQTVENSYIEPATGLTVVRIKCIQDLGDTTATVLGAWNTVLECSAVGLAAKATKDWYFDGTNVKIAGFEANDTVMVTIKGIRA